MVSRSPTRLPDLTLATKGVITSGVEYEGNLQIIDLINDGSDLPTIDIDVEPTSATVGAIVKLKMTGLNWSGGSSALVIDNEDEGALNIRSQSSGTDTFELRRGGDIVLKTQIRFNSAGRILTTSNTDLTFLPDGTGITIIGDAGSTSHTLNTNDDLFIAGRLEVDGTAFFDGLIDSHNNMRFINSSKLQFGNSLDAIMVWSTAQTNDSLLLTLGNTSRTVIICETADIAVDFGHDNSINPTLFIQSADATEISEYSTNSWNHTGIGGGSGSFIGLKSISELVTVPVAEGNTPTVATIGNLAPANSLIMGVTARVTDAPGGGATTIDIGITSGDADALIDGISTVLNTTGNTPANGNSGAQMPLHNSSATTLTITTDADVTGDEMKVRITTFYLEFIPPTS